MRCRSTSTAGACLLPSKAESAISDSRSMPSPARNGTDVPHDGDPNTFVRAGHGLRGKGLFEIRDQIIRVLDAGRKPYERIGYADRLSLCLRDRAMRHQRRMLDEAFDAAQAFGKREQFRRSRNRFRAGQITIQIH